MTISVESIEENVLESVEWSYQHKELHAHNVDFSDAIHEAIDSALIYTSDVLGYWQHAGMPVVDDMGEHDSIMSAITWSVYVDLSENVSEYSILEAFLESHAGTLETLDVDLSTSDAEEAYAALVDYMDGL